MVTAYGSEPRANDLSLLRRRGFGALFDGEFHVDVVAGGVGIGAHLMGLGDQRLGLTPRNARHGDRQCDGQAEAPFLPRSYADCGGHRRVAWHPLASGGQIMRTIASADYNDMHSWSHTSHHFGNVCI